MSVEPIKLSGFLTDPGPDVAVTELTAEELLVLERADLVAIELVPVEVFGAEDGYGLSDAVSSWSDCNRARGRIYRAEDLHGPREPGETLRVFVRREDVPWFSKRFGS